MLRFGRRRTARAIRSLLGTEGLAERIAGFESAIGEIVAGPQDATSTNSSIARQLRESGDTREFGRAGHASGDGQDPSVPARSGAASGNSIRLAGGGCGRSYGPMLHQPGAPSGTPILISRYRQTRLLRIDSFDSVKRQFFASSQSDIIRLDQWFERHGRAVPFHGTIAEYGCGVGRSTPTLARKFARIKAYDISRPHLALCKDRLNLDFATNAELIHISDFESLNRLADYDLFYSCIVLQHNPPPLIAAILRQALRGLNPGGFGYFQVPTYSRGYSFELERYVTQLQDGSISTEAMEMHLLPQETVFRIIAECGCSVLEVQPDYCVGSFDDWISNTFFVEKPPRHQG